MNREIKFRGISIETGEWIYGYLIKYLNNESYILTHDHMDDTLDKNKVIPESVGECTGLKGKDGNEVYELDIIPINGYNYTIEFRDGCFGVEMGDDFISLKDLIANGWWVDPIGNIHESPDLLK